MLCINLFIILLAQARSEDNLAPNIFGGKQTKMGQYPWVALMTEIYLIENVLLVM
jgi:secreted trypsin-like serine protease